ncbi:MAG: urate oxidase [Acidobacteria bacterium]|jgi:urate oxidase|nr:urate oxidase [Acidobacteriota bacterium]MBA4182812.1 urate oxidase [Acidobacteriota bacterium]
MSVKIVHNNYGKSRVRLLKVARLGEWHELQETTVKIAFEGEFTEVHTVGDNSHVLPTDTMKNTVYALASQTQEIEEIETFAMRLANHFLTNNSPVKRVIIEIAEHGWTRMAFGGQSHPHSFIKGSNEKHTAKVSIMHEGATIESGVEDLIVLKTTKSGFVGYIKDQYTTLPETTDRILATSIKADWRYADSEKAAGDTWRDVRQTIIETFAEHNSLSVQHTLYAMGEAVLEKFPDIAEISFSLPNIHYLPLDLARLGLENGNQIFLPTDEPHGLIEARLSR